MPHLQLDELLVVVSSLEKVGQQKHLGPGGGPVGLEPKEVPPADRHGPMG